MAELAPDSWIALKKRSDDLLRAEKWAESEAVARQILESGPFTLERAQPLINVIFAMGRIDETIELQAQVMALEPRAMFVSRDQQWNLYAAGRFEEAEAEYQRSQTLDGSHSNPNFAGLAARSGAPGRRSAGPARVVSRYLVRERPDAAVAGMTSAPPSRTARECWRFSERLSRPERRSFPQWRMRWETGTSR